jgi:hypothetical protein
MPYFFFVCTTYKKYLFYTTSSDETLHFVSLRLTQGFVKFQMHMSSNMLQSVENFNVQANIIGNFVRDVDICTQVYYSFIDTI